MFCPSCGAENRSGREYCDRCGERVAPPNQERLNRSDLAKCAKCGAINHARAPHCIGCGILRDQTNALPLPAISEPPERPRPVQPRGEPRGDPRVDSRPEARSEPRAEPQGELRGEPRAERPPEKNGEPGQESPASARSEPPPPASEARRPAEKARTRRDETHAGGRFGPPHRSPEQVAQPEAANAHGADSAARIERGPFVNDSGARDATLPEELKGWNWAAFMWGMIGFAPIWGYLNRVWIALVLAFVWLSPFMPAGWRGPMIVAALVVTVYLGFKGNELAWRARRWESVDQFKRVQQSWMTWGMLIAVAQIVFYLIFVYMARG
ncbi:MAG: hypothetical protein FJ314_09265 [SAR202 cluster bacterium]|nr:hypothetical protein [SAR202 cluster bacterium]